MTAAAPSGDERTPTGAFPTRSERVVVRPAPSSRVGQSAGATVVLVVGGVVLLTLAAVGVVALLGSGSRAGVVLGLVLAGMLAAGVAAAVLVVGYPRRDRLEVVVTPHAVVLPAPPALPWINRAFASFATLLIVPSALTLLDRGGQRADLPIFAGVTALVIGLMAAPAAVRAWRGRARYTALTLDPSGLLLVGARGVRTLGWEDVLGVRIEGARLRISGADGSTAMDLGVRDLASDARLVADVVDLYRRRPGLRREIGPAALQRWKRGLG